MNAIAETAVNPNKALWEKGDFTRIASSMRRSGEMLVDSLGIRPGMKVLDLGCGDGTTAIPAARLGAQVLGVDIVSNLVRAGNRRAREEGVANCRFVEGDACDLQGIESRSFDLVVSIFGAMFAPRPFDAAREMVRVTRPGGRIVMGNWIPGDPTLVAQILKTSAAYSPPPPAGFVSPMSWGVETHVIERFGAAGVAAGHIAFARDLCLRDGPPGGRLPGRLPPVLRADDERLRRRRRPGPGRGAAAGPAGPVRAREPQRVEGCDAHSGHLPQDDGELPLRQPPRRGSAAARLGQSVGDRLERWLRRRPRR